MRKPRKGRVHPNQYGSPGTMGNTTGIIVPVDSPMAQKATIKPETPAEKSWWDSWGDSVHLGLDVVGMIPIVGEVADLANAAIYAAEGDYVNASISAASAVPGVGNAATAAKWTKRGVDAVDAANDLRKVDKAADAAQAAKRADDVPTAGGKPPGKDSGGKSRKNKKGPCDHLRQGSGKGPYRGGAHSKTSKPANDNKDSHHMPAKSTSPLKEKDGPAIQMDPQDHQLTSSHGTQGLAGQQYRSKIQALIDSGKWREAMATEILDIRELQRALGDPKKYNEAMLEMLEYFKCLEQHELLG
jgi:hypothetical protein